MSEPFDVLTSDQQLDDFLAQPGARWLYKHSKTCGVSFSAKEQVEDYLNGSGDPAAMVVVQDRRPISNRIAELTGYTHQSPQLFLMVDGKPVWHASHWSITVAAMQEARQQV